MSVFQGALAVAGGDPFLQFDDLEAVFPLRRARLLGLIFTSGLWGRLHLAWLHGGTSFHSLSLCSTKGQRERENGLRCQKAEAPDGQTNRPVSANCGLKPAEGCSQPPLNVKDASCRWR